jgi:signal transduction histidine kinase
VDFRLRKFVLPAISVVLPLMLLYSSLRTFHELDRQRQVYLQSRAAAIAARLETLPEGDLERIGQDELGLVDLLILRSPASVDGDPLAPLWAGRELFRIETLQVEREPVFRAWVPFHSPYGLCLARIDLAERSADFLLIHARHNVLIATAGGIVVVALSLATAWGAQRAARSEQLQLELEHLAQIGKMSAVLAHEIRNPLGTIKGFAQLLGEKLRGPDAQLLSPILSETKRLEALVRDLLLYSRPPQPVLQRVSTAGIVEALRAHAIQMIGSRPIRFEAAVPDITISTDPNLLQQALLNVLRNSVETLEGADHGTIGLSFDAGAEEVRFELWDDGPGLTDQARSRLFEPFYTTKLSGSGLGLAITRKLVASLGGDFSLVDRPEGGTLARIRLNRVAEEEEG